ncbi:MAG TPA: choice-of-anchor tandem repeat GloVer-containing protein [Candidatus Binatia bacterium]|nr:choice-of-anchor tandem repeat GloVer-containing protein [Candidatus Binatia bacterium]
MTFDVTGNLYGTTFADGPYGQGDVFRLSPANGRWTYTSLHDFTGGDDGAMPDGAVVLDSAGNIYGTTENGGHQFGNGVAWEIAP